MDIPIQEEVARAILYLQDYCDKQDPTCLRCPLYSFKHGGCYFGKDNAPKDWDDIIKTEGFSLRRE